MALPHQTQYFDILVQRKNEGLGMTFPLKMLAEIIHSQAIF